jgi:hypothetical protein
VIHRSTTVSCKQQRCHCGLRCSTLIAKKRTWTAEVHGMFGGKPTIKGERRHLPPYLIRKAGSIVPYPFPLSCFPLTLFLQQLHMINHPSKTGRSPLSLIKSWLAPSLCMSQILGKVFSKGIEGIPAVRGRKERLIKLFSSLF